jgi:hypothetical protein
MVGGKLEGCLDMFLLLIFDFYVLADENKIKIVQEGALPHIITLMRSPQDSVLIQATGCLRNLSVHRESRSSFSELCL